MTPSTHLRRFDFFALQDFAGSGQEIVAESPEDEEPETGEPETPPMLFTQEQLDEAKRRAYAEGMEAGRAEEQASDTKAEIEAQEVLRQQTAQMQHELANASQAMAQAIDETTTQLQALACHVGSKLAGEALQQAPEAAARAMLETCLPYVLTEPRLVVRTPPALESRMESLISEQVTASGYHGDVTVRADAELQPGDIRLEWQSGAAERRLEHMMAQLHQAFPSLAALASAGSPEASSPPTPDASGSSPSKPVSQGVN